MIPNTSPCYDHSLRDVVAWSDEGHGLVIDHKTGRLAEAVGPLTNSDTPTQLIPGDGWEVIYRPGTTSECREPLVAWAVTADGVIPLASDANGQVDDARSDGALIVPVGLVAAPSIPADEPDCASDDRADDGGLVCD